MSYVRLDQRALCDRAAWSGPLVCGHTVTEPRDPGGRVGTEGGTLGRQDRVATASDRDDTVVVVEQVERVILARALSRRIAHEGRAVARAKRAGAERTRPGRRVCARPHRDRRARRVVVDLHDGLTGAVDRFLGGDDRVRQRVEVRLRIDRRVVEVIAVAPLARNPAIRELLCDLDRCLSVSDSRDGTTLPGQATSGVARYLRPSSCTIRPSARLATKPRWNRLQPARGDTES